MMEHFSDLRCLLDLLLFAVRLSHHVSSFSNHGCLCMFHISDISLSLLDSHPKFNRDDTTALCLIKRVKKNKTTSKAGVSGSTSSNAAYNALKSRISNRRYGIRDGDRTIMFPSLLD